MKTKIFLFLAIFFSISAVGIEGDTNRGPVALTLSRSWFQFGEIDDLREKFCEGGTLRLRKDAKKCVFANNDGNTYVELSVTNGMRVLDILSAAGKITWTNVLRPQLRLIAQNAITQSPNDRMDSQGLRVFLEMPVLPGDIVCYCVQR